MNAKVEHGGSREAASVQEKMDKAVPIKSEPVSIQEYVDTLDRDGKVLVPCPHGKGEYYIDIRPQTLMQTSYGTPACIFSSEDKSGEYGLKAAPAYLRTNYGRHILWYPIGLGFARYTQSREKSGDRKFQLALGKMLIGIILSGRRLYAMSCGENINSWSTDEEALSYMDYYEER